MSDLARLGLVFETQGAEKAGRDLSNIERGAAKAEKATDALGAASRRGASAIMEMMASIEKSTAAMAQLMGAAANSNAQMGRLPAIHRAGAASAKMQSMEALNLSRQLADVATSAAMGINPLMILIQQGPQVADVFQQAASEGRSFSTVMRGLGAQIGPMLVSGGLIGLLVAGVGAVAAGFVLGRRESENFQRSLVATGNYAGVTAQSVEDMAKRVASASGSTIHSSRAIIEQLVASGQYSGKTIELMTKNVEGFARLTGQSTKAVLADFEEMKGGVVKWAVQHVEAYHDLTLAQIDYLDKLEKEGKHEAAARQLHEDLAKSIEGRTVPAYGALQRALHGVANAATDMWDKLLGIGRTKTVEEQITIAQGRVTALQNYYAQHNSAAIVGVGGVNPQDLSSGKALRDAQAQLASLRAQKAGQDAAAVAAGAKAQAEADAIRKKYDTPGMSHKQPPADTTAQRTQQVAEAIAQAKVAELQAQLDLTRSTEARGKIEREIIAAETAEKIVGIERQKAELEADKGLPAAKKKELVAQLDAVEKTEKHVGALRDQAARDKTADQLSQDRLAVETAQKEAQIDLLRTQGGLLKSGYARAVVDLKVLELQQSIERAKLEEVVNSKTALETEKQIARAKLDTLSAMQAAEQAQAKEQTDLVHAIQSAADAASGFRDAFRRHDWASAADALVSAMQTIRSSTDRLGAMGGIGSLAAVGSNVLGGTAGKVLGGVSAGFGAYAGLSSLGGALSLGGSLSSLGTLGIGNMLTMAAGPIGIAIAAVTAIAALVSAFQKPTNAGAGYDLISGQFSGNKRTSETEGAVKQAGDAILAMQTALKSSGVGLGDTIRGLVIGSRDQSQIYTAGGKTLYSAVGDPQAAVEAAFKAMLDGATYVTDTQKNLVESMVAAGKGFDEVATALQSYADAQASLKAIPDAILQLTDPKQYDLTMLQRAQDARRQSFTDAATGGFISADQLATVLGQLQTLDKLELDKVLSQYADAYVDATKAAVDATKELAAAQQAAADAVSQAQATALDAYNRESQAFKATADRMNALADSLHAYGAGLIGESGLLSPRQTYASAKAAFNGLGTDEASLNKLQSVSDAYLAAAKAAAPDARAYARDLAAVRSKVADAELVAREQAGIAQRQLDAMTTVASTLGLINTNLVTFAQAVEALANARAVQTAVTGGGAGVANDNLARGYASTNGDYALFVAGNSDLLAAYNSYGAARGQTMAQFGEQVWNDPNSIAANHTRGVQAFATGGSFDVFGPSFGDQVPVHFMANGGEHVNVSREDSMARVADALDAQNDLLAQLVRVTEKGAKAADDMNKTGVYARGVSPGEAVSTQAA